MTRTEVIAMLRQVADRYPRKIDAAVAFGVSNSYLSDVLRGHKLPNNSMLRRIGIRKYREWRFERI